MNINYGRLVTGLFALAAIIIFALGEMEHITRSTAKTGIWICIIGMVLSWGFRLWRHPKKK